MTIAKIKKGEKLSCSACGREVIINECGISDSTLWCCDKPMETAGRTSGKKNITSKGKKKK